MNPLFYVPVVLLSQQLGQCHDNGSSQFCVKDNVTCQTHYNVNHVSRDCFDSEGNEWGKSDLSIGRQIYSSGRDELGREWTAITEVKAKLSTTIVKEHHNGGVIAIIKCNNGNCEADTYVSSN